MLTQTKPALSAPSKTSPGVPSAPDMQRAFTNLAISGSSASWSVEAYILIIESRTCECCQITYETPARSPRVLLRSRIEPTTTRTISIRELRERLELRDLYGGFMMESGLRANKDDIYPTLPRYLRYVDLDVEYCQNCFHTIDSNQAEMWPVKAPPRLPASQLELLLTIQRERKEVKAGRKTGYSSVPQRPLAELIMGNDWFGSATKAEANNTIKAGKKHKKQRRSKPKKLPIFNLGNLLE